MTDSPRDLLLSADRDASSRLNRLRADVLNRELGSRWTIFTRRSLVAVWILIALLKAFTPGKAEVDPRAAELARAQRLLSQQASAVGSRSFEPSESRRIP